MGKNVVQPSRGEHTDEIAAGGDSPPPGEVLYVQGDPNLSAEQRRKYDGLRRWLDERAAQWERMTPAEKAKAEADWQVFKKLVNEERARAGMRLLYGDDD